MVASALNPRGTSPNTAPRQRHALARITALLSVVRGASPSIDASPGNAVQQFLDAVQLQPPDPMFSVGAPRGDATTFFQNGATKDEWLVELDRYKRYSVSKLRDNMQPRALSIEKDIAMVPAMIAMLRAKSPTLHLRRTDSPAELIRHAASLAQAHNTLKEAGLQQVESLVLARLGRQHHALAHVELGANGQAQITLFDSAQASFDSVKDAMQAINLALRGTSSIKLIYVCSGAQLSPADCVIFALSLAQPVHEEQVAQSIRQGVSDGSLRGRIDLAYPGISLIVEHDEGQLPAVLFEHATSSKQIDALPPSETKRRLQKKHVASQVSRDGRNYSASIEMERIRLLDETVRHVRRAGSDAELKADISVVLA